MNIRDFGAVEPSRCGSCFVGVQVAGQEVRACSKCGLHKSDEAAISLVLLLLAYAEREARIPPVH